MPENTPSPPRLLDQLRDKIRLRHYGLSTERLFFHLFVHWAKRFVFFHGNRHPADMGAAEVEAFLTHLAVEVEVSTSTQNQALSALLFLYREELGVDLPWILQVVRAKRPAPPASVDNRA